MSILDWFRPRCPHCNKHGLRQRMSKTMVEADKTGMRVRPAWFYFQCVRCDAKFKREISGDRRWLVVTDEEWQMSVEGKTIIFRSITPLLGFDCWTVKDDGYEVGGSFLHSGKVNDIAYRLEIIRASMGEQQFVDLATGLPAEMIPQLLFPEACMPFENCR